MGYSNVERDRTRVAALGLVGSVTLTGRVEYREAPDYLALGDAAVSAEHVIMESNGKLLNYMAMGLPVVAYDGPVSRELLGEHGVFVPMRNVPALAAALARLVRDPQEQKLRGQALRERVVARFASSTLAGASWRSTEASSGSHRRSRFEHIAGLGLVRVRGRRRRPRDQSARRRHRDGPAGSGGPDLRGDWYGPRARWPSPSFADGVLDSRADGRRHDAPDANRASLGVAACEAGQIVLTVMCLGSV